MTLKRAVMYLLVAPIGLVGVVLAVDAISLQSAYARNVGKVFRIDVYKEGQLRSCGSGVLVKTGGLVLTANHVVDGKKETYKAVEINGTTYECVVQRRDVARDLAIIACGGLSGRVPVRISQTRKLRVGDRVFHIGAPRGITLMLTDGIVSQLRESKGDVMITALGAPGSSGGPVFNSDGDLIGVVQRCYIGVEWGSNAVIMASPLKIYRFMRGEL